MELKRHDLEEGMLDLDRMIQEGILPQEHGRLKLTLKQLALIITENSDNLEKKSWDLESKVRPWDSAVYGNAIKRSILSGANQGYTKR